MGERAKIILNEYSARDLLKRDTLNLDKFYTADLKLFVEVARKEIKSLNNIINELEKDLEEKIDEDRLNILSNSHWKYVLDKLKELKGSDKE